MAGLGDVISVDADDISQLWHEIPTDLQDPVQELIDRAIAILPSQSPGLLDRLEAGTTPPEAVEQVIIQAVRRAIMPVLVNPDGAKKRTQAIDDYSESLEWDFTVISGGLYFTGRELASVDAPAPRRGKAYTIDTTPVR